MSDFAPYMIRLVPFVHPDMGHAVVVLTCGECPEPTVITRYAEPHEPTVFEIFGASYAHWQKEHG